MGASRGTSVASIGLRSLLPYEMPIGIMGTRVLGGLAGRLVPYVGVGLLAYDAYSIGQCTITCAGGVGNGPQ